MVSSFHARGTREPGIEVRELRANAVARLAGERGLLLRVAHGQVVVTRAGDPEDHVLEAGAELDLSGSRRALAWALHPSRLELRREPLRAGAPADVALAR